MLQKNQINFSKFLINTKSMSKAFRLQTVSNRAKFTMHECPVPPIFSSPPHSTLSSEKQNILILYTSLILLNVLLT